MSRPSSSTSVGSMDRSMTPERLGMKQSISRHPMEKFTFTLGKLDAGMAILLGPNAHLLEFPSLLLPTPAPGTPPLGPGAILNITVSRDLSAEKRAEDEFDDLQAEILESFSAPPTKPKLKLRNITQTTVSLDWDKIELGSADFISLEMFRNGQRWGRVGGEPGKKEKLEWKTGGLQSGEEYTFQLILKTTAGVWPSDIVRVRTHTMDNLTGLYIHFGPIQPESLLKQLRTSLQDIQARESSKMALDTTHFVCTTPITGGDDEGRGGVVDPDYQEAIRANIPVVGPDWLLAVARERKLVPISGYLLPALPASASRSPDPAPFKRPEPQKRASLPFTNPAPTSPIRERPEELRRSPSPETIARMSMTGSGKNGSSSGGSLERRPSIGNSLPTQLFQERRGSGSGSKPLEIETSRPRSPKPEADGKLDRSFKFPLSSEASNSAGVPDSAPATMTTAGISMSSSIGDKIVDTAQAPNSAPISAPAPFSSSLPSTVENDVQTSPTLELQKVRSRTPEITVTPPADTILDDPMLSSNLATEGSPTDEAGDIPAEPARAATIDEAIAKFEDAVGHSISKDPVETDTTATTSETLPAVIAETPTKEATEAEKAEAPEEPRPSTSPPAVNGHNAEPDVKGAVEESPIPFRRHSGLTKATSRVSNDNEVVEEPTEGVTMDEIDLT